MKLEISDGKLGIDLGSLEKTLAVRGGFGIPLSNITKVGTSAPKTSWKEVRAPGTYLPGAIKAGTYYTPRGKEFWYVTEKGVLVLELENEPYKRIVLSIDDNEEWAQKVRKATSREH